MTRLLIIIIIQALRSKSCENLGSEKFFKKPVRQIVKDGYQNYKPLSTIARL